jgi:hypothetical protein
MRRASHGPTPYRFIGNPFAFEEPAFARRGFFACVHLRKDLCNVKVAHGE